MEEKRITAESIKDVVGATVRRLYLQGEKSFKIEKKLFYDLKVEITAEKIGYDGMDVQARVYVFYKDMWEELTVWGQRVFSQPSKRAINNGTEDKSMVNYLLKNNFLPQLIVDGLYEENNKRLERLAQAHAIALQMYGQNNPA